MPSVGPSPNTALPQPQGLEKHGILLSNGWSTTSTHLDQGRTPWARTPARATVHHTVIKREPSEKGDNGGPPPDKRSKRSTSIDDKPVKRTPIENGLSVRGRWTRIVRPARSRVG